MDVFEFNYDNGDENGGNESYCKLYLGFNYKYMYIVVRKWNMVV